MEWRRPSELGRLFSIFPPEREYVDDDGETYLDTERPYLDPEDRRRVQAPKSVERWLRQDYVSYGDDGPEEGSDRGWDDYTFLDPLLALSDLTLDGGWPVVVREPTDPELVPGEFSLLNMLEGPNAPIVMPYSGDLRGVLAASFVRDPLNRDHPLVRLAVAAQYKERLNEVERFAEELVRHAAETTDFYEAVARGYPVAQDWLRYLGAMFRAVDWSSVDEVYHPPYRLWSRKGASIRRPRKGSSSGLTSRPGTSNKRGHLE